MYSLHIPSEAQQKDAKPHKSADEAIHAGESLCTAVWVYRLAGVARSVGAQVCVYLGGVG